MNWADFKIAIAKGLVASAESVAKIISGTTTVGNADKLDGKHATDFALISGATMLGDINMNGCKVRQCSGDYSAELKGQYANACIEVREKDLVGGSSNDIGYAPAIGFHWAGVVGAAILMDSTGGFHFVRSDGTYCPLRTSSANVIVSTTAPVDTTAVWIVP